MGWVYQQKDQHKCKKPGGSKDVKAGDVWECDDESCKKQWRVRTIDKWYDQRDGFTGYNLIWDEVPARPFWGL